MTQSTTGLPGDEGQVGGEPPIVTVVMPTYERTDILRVALDSLLNQTMPNFVAIVNDNSRSDAVENLLAEYVDSRLTYHRNTPPTAGGPQNVLAAMKRVTTPYACILCDDDVLLDNYLEALLAPLQADPSVDVAFCDYEVIDAKGRVDVEETLATSRRSGRNGLMGGRLDLSRFELLKLVMGRHAVRLSWAAVFKTQAFLDCEADEEFVYVDDLCIAYNMVMNGKTFAFVDGFLSQLRIHDNSYTGSSQQHVSEDALYEYAIGVADEREREMLRIAIGRIHFSRGTSSINSNLPKAREELRKASRYEVGSRKLFATLVGRSEIFARAAALSLVALHAKRQRQ